MKKLYPIFLCLIISFGFNQLLNAQTALAPNVGDGSSTCPFEIENWQNLYWLSQNSDQWSKNFIQIADIDLSIASPVISSWEGGKGFSPIGSASKRFTGSYDGQNHKIKGLYINRSSYDYIGLFGFVNKATILNLKVTNADITGNNHVGILAGAIENYCTVQNCYSSGSALGNNYLGGFIGENKGGVIENCNSSGDVTGFSDYIGGLIGFNFTYATIDNCSSECVVVGNYHVGGLVGQNRDVSIVKNSYSTGNVNGSLNNIGGLVGTNSGSSKIIYCYSSSSVSGYENIGGLVGYNYKSSIVQNCYSTGSISGNIDIGGLMGENALGSYINCCYSLGPVSGDSNIGGLLGYNFGLLITNSFWDRETSGQTTSAGGTGKTTAELQTLSTFTDTDTEGLDVAWDFVDNPNDDTGEEDHWDFNSVISGYPYLSWQTGESMMIASGNTEPHSFAPAGVSLQFTSGNAQDIELGIFRTDSLPTVVGALPDGVQNLSPRHWTATLTGASSGTYTITFDITGLSGINECTSLRVLKRVNNTSPWIDVETLGGVVSYDCPNTITVTGLSGFSTFVLGGGSENPLPVELAGFSGSSTIQGIELQWKTVAETDNAGFVLNRNGVEIASYKNTESLKGEGTTSQEHSYSYIDSDVSLDETHIYELVSVDYSGTRHTYSKMVEVTVTEALETQKVYEYVLSQNYPNPFNPSTTIHFTMKQAGIATLKVYDMLGRMVSQKRIEARLGTNNITFNASGLSSGVYFYQLSTEGFSKTMKMMLVR